MLRTHTCGELRPENEDQTTTLCGWVHRRRDHGGVIFIDLRDRYGLTQIKFDPNLNATSHAAAEALRSEWVIKAVGTVKKRPENMVNPKLATGAIEVEVNELTILSESQTPPFELEEEKNLEVKEAMRLKYRFVDLRRPKIQEMLRIKDEVIRHCRDYMHRNGFIDIQTPILASSSPEGARDFLIPSRLHPGTFYALPQAPQMFKQLLMVGGLDRYFQIAPCFRDEDTRMDRHYGEFYQLDMEMSFVEQDDILKMMEPLMIELTEKFSRKKIVGLTADGRFPQIPFREAMEKYGSDKPDLRFDLPIVPVTDCVRGCGFKVFAEMAEKDGHVVHALRVPGGASFTRKEIDEFTAVAAGKGAKGLAYIVVRPKGDASVEAALPVSSTSHPSAGGEYILQSPIVKFLGEDVCVKVLETVGATVGDIVFFGADNWETVCLSLGAVRNACAEKQGLKDNAKAAWCWVVDFPFYAPSELDPGRIDFGHNPFSMPQGGMEALTTRAPLDILAHQFDLVVNGFEASSGAIRNHEPEIMYKAFEIAGYPREEVDARFGAMVRAFQYGAPPHGGNAPGLDRILMVLSDWDSIRDIYAFPKDGAGRDLMMDSPHEATEKQLRELHIKLRKE